MFRKLCFPALSVLCVSLLSTDIILAKQTTAFKQNQSNQKRLETVKTARSLYKFGDLNIKIAQSSVEEKKNDTVNDAFLKAHISVDKNGTIVDKLSFDCMQDMGYVAGLFIPKPQPLTDYFLIVKHGDYDGHLLLINKNGKINNIDGGSYFITADKHYIFSNWEGDTMGTGVTVFDLLTNQIVYKTGKKDSALFDNIDQWYKDNQGYFFTASHTDDEGQQKTKDNWIFAYQFGSNKLLREPAKSRLKNAKKIQLNPVDDQRSAVLVP